LKRILVINPNTSNQMTRHIREVLEKTKFASTFFQVVQIREGPESVESAYDATLAATEVVKIVQEKAKEVDAVLVACFADPGLEAARELCEAPVLGIMETSIYVACMLGEKFSILATSSRRAHTKYRFVRSLGLSDRLQSVIPVEVAVTEMLANREEFLRAVRNAAREAITGGAEVVILGCAAMAGLAEQLQSEICIPVVDPVVVGFKLAETLAGIGLTQYKSRTRLPVSSVPS